MPSTQPCQDHKETLHLFETGFPVLLNISLLLLLAEAVIFLPYIQISGLLSWALCFGGLQILSRQVGFFQSPQKIVLVTTIAGILVGLGPVVFLYIGTVTQLYVIPSVMLVLTACSLPLLGNYLPAIAGFVVATVTAFTTAMLWLDNDLPLNWPACWVILGLVILWTGYFCSKRNSR